MIRVDSWRISGIRTIIVIIADAVLGISQSISSDTTWYILLLVLYYLIDLLLLMVLRVVSKRCLVWSVTILRHFLWATTTCMHLITQHGGVYIILISWIFILIYLIWIEKASSHSFQPEFLSRFDDITLTLLYLGLMLFLIYVLSGPRIETTVLNICQICSIPISILLISNPGRSFVT